MKKLVYLFLLVNYSLLFAAKIQVNMNMLGNDHDIIKLKVDSIYEAYFHTAIDDSNSPIAEAIDLGLPSGTKWASWNVGASASWEYGDYYAWGETELKDYYDWSSYTYCNGSYSTCHHIGDEIAGSKYDVAHIKWGGSWRMPSLEQVKELINCCTRMWIQQKGVYGTLVIGPNGASIFLPAAGYRWQDNLYNEGLIGYYWLSTPYPYHECDAFNFNFNSGYWYWSNNYRSFGFPVRPVCH